MVTDVYSHIIDDDRKKNAALLVLLAKAMEK